MNAIVTKDMIIPVSSIAAIMRFTPKIIHIYLRGLPAVDNCITIAYPSADECANAYAVAMHAFEDLYPIEKNIFE